MANKIHHYGGQAVIEGVMIRGKKNMVTVVRKPNGEMVVDKKPLSTLYTGWMRSAPLLRGIIVLIESLVFGIQTLMYSANIALEEETAKENEKVGGWWMWAMLAVSMVFAVALFFLAPLFLTRLLNIESSSIIFNLVEGIIRIAMFILYLRLVSLMPDIKRVFAYHGAEHKSVNGFEAGAPLEPEAIKKYSKAHVRCGGSFLFVVMIIAIIVFSMVGLLGIKGLWFLVLSRIVLVPVIAALGYEFIHFGANHVKNIIIRILLAPGMWLQALTTSEPDDKQLEVGILAMKTAVEADQEESPQSSV
ncbi:MAG: DUF1385 domain-containing protein [Dehalococcoidales bacterium]|nr:DUF1385 domain-containing protein [Dehalococcoidales bacterium]